MMGSESCEEDEGGLPLRRIPRVCLRRKPGTAASVHVTVSHGSIDLKNIGLVPSSSPGLGERGLSRQQPASLAQPGSETQGLQQSPSAASFSITKILPSHHGQVSAAAAAAPRPLAAEASSATAAAAAAAAWGQAKKAVVRDSGLFNAFDAFEREFERFQHEVQHNYLSQGCSDREPGAYSTAATAAATLVSPLPAIAAEPAQCSQCGKCTGHGFVATRHGLPAATNSTDACIAVPTSRLPTQHGTVVLSECCACPADPAPPTCSCTGQNDRGATLQRPTMLPVNRATSTDFNAAVAALTDCTPLSEALSGSVISLFIEEDDQDGYVKRWLSETSAKDGDASPANRLSGPQPADPLPADACGRARSPIGGLAKCVTTAAQTRAQRQSAPSDGCASSPAASLPDCPRRQQQRSMAVFDSSKFRKLKELAESVELEPSDFCTLPEFELLYPLPAYSDVDGTTAVVAAVPPGCKYTSHHECVRLVPATCKGFNSADVGDGCVTGIGGTVSVAQTADQSLPKQLYAAAAAAAERDDADSGYGGSGGSLPPQGSAGARGGSSSKQYAEAAADSADGRSSTMPAVGREELCKLIRQYNLRCGSTQLLTMPDGEDTMFQGCIQVCISLSRPINMVLSSRPASIYEALNRGEGVVAQVSSSAAARPLVQPRITTAQVSLPTNAVMSLHITSEHTAVDVVQKLLAKFKITDNPKKFALYEQTLVDGSEVKLHKVADIERPLMSFLLWSSAVRSSGQQRQEAKRFVLKEDNNGDVNWDAFCIPELLAFLRILEREEKDYADEIRHKYIARRKHLETALKEARGSSTTASQLPRIRQ